MTKKLPKPKLADMYAREDLASVTQKFSQLPPEKQFMYLAAALHNVALNEHMVATAAQLRLPLGEKK